MDDNPGQNISALCSIFPRLGLATIQSVLQMHDGDKKQAVKTLLAIEEESEVEGAIHQNRENHQLPPANSILGMQTPSEVEPVQRPINVSSSRSSGPLKLLSLDGGGYRGLALFYSLRQIMRNIPGVDPSEKLYPHKYFDLIGGTSTGALAAIMLGRLGMDIQAAIEKYQELGPTIFGNDRGTFLGVVVQGAHFDCKPFEDALAKWVEDQPMLDPDVDQHCRCFVTTVPGQLANVITPTIIRSYSDPPRSTVFSHEWLIREAARATSAAPTYFPPLNLGNGYTFVDAGAFGFNNPTSLMLKEAEQIPEFAGRSIGCVVSIGTGLASLARAVGPTNLNSISDPDIATQRIVQRTLQNAKKLFKTPREAYGRLKQLRDDLIATATNTEATHHSVFWELRGRKSDVTYIRLNPVGGLDTIDLAQFTRGADIEAITNQYLEIPEVAEQVVKFAASFSPVMADPLRTGIPEADLPPKVLRSLKKDTAVNMLSGDLITGFVVLPKFSKGLSGSGLKIQLDSTTRFGSCAFDLAERLGLVSNLSNKSLGESETVFLRDLVHNDETYCARISRHFLVLLISEHVQELWQVDDRSYISTDIGQFTLYSHGGRSLVHFDGSIRRSTATVMQDQDLEVIQRIANGEAKPVSELGSWIKTTNIILSISLAPLPLAVRYLRTKDIEDWRLLREFAGVLGEVVISVVRAVTAPASFVAAMAAADWKAYGAAYRLGDQSNVLDRFANLTQMIHGNLESQASDKHPITLEKRDLLIQVAHSLLNDAAAVHESFRGRPVDHRTFITRSLDRFEILFKQYSLGRDREPIQQEIQNLLNPRAENIGLVVAQSAFAFLVISNARAVLGLAKEAPEEWIRIVVADDGDMFIGA